MMPRLSRELDPDALCELTPSSRQWTSYRPRPSAAHTRERHTHPAPPQRPKRARILVRTRRSRAPRTKSLIDPAETSPAGLRTSDENLPHTPSANERAMPRENTNCAARRVPDWPTDRPSARAATTIRRANSPSKLASSQAVKMTAATSAVLARRRVPSNPSERKI